MIIGSSPCYFVVLHRGRIWDLLWTGWHHHGRGDGGQSLVEGMEQRRTSGLISCQLCGDHIVRQTHARTKIQTHIDTHSGTPSSLTLMRVFFNLILPLKLCTLYFVGRIKKHEDPCFVGSKKEKCNSRFWCFWGKQKFSQVCRNYPASFSRIK